MLPKLGWRRCIRMINFRLQGKYFCPNASPPTKKRDVQNWAWALHSDDKFSASRQRFLPECVGAYKKMVKRCCPNWGWAKHSERRFSTSRQRFLPECLAPTKKRKKIEKNGKTGTTFKLIYLTVDKRSITL